MTKVIQIKAVKSLILMMFGIIIYSLFANVSVYADDTITVTLPSDSVNLSITPTSTGVFDSVDLDVQVTTSNTAGYTLNMTAATTSLYGTAAVNGKTPTIPTLPNQFSQASFPVGYWGYKLNADTNYSPITTSITIADPDESIANTSISNIITFAAKLNNDTPSGAYNTALTFTVIGKSLPSFTITYNANGGTSTPSPQTDSKIILPSNLTYSGGASYATLAGWDTNAMATTATYRAGDTIIPPSDMTLYAIWSFASNTLQYNAINNTGSSNCSSTSASWYDARTGVAYPIYYTGNACWLTKNLYLPANKTIYPSDSHVALSWTTPLSSSYNLSYTTPYMYAGSYNSNTGTGGWYNFCAASAGTDCNDDGVRSIYEYDICPKGWKIPTLSQQKSLGTAGTSNWNPTAGGSYTYVNGVGNQLYSTDWGHWWIINSNSNTGTQGKLSYSSSQAKFVNAAYQSNNPKRTMIFVRCVREK